MSLKQKLVVISTLLLLFSSCATINESVKNDDVLLKTYTVKENTGYQYEVNYQFKDAPQFEDVTLNVSVKAYQMCKTKEMGVYDRTEIVQRTTNYSNTLFGDDGCYKFGALTALIGVGLIALPICIVDSFRAMDSTQHVGKVTKEIKSSEPERCSGLSSAQTQVLLALNNGGESKSTDAAGNATFSIKELGEFAKKFFNPWASLKVKGVEKDISIPEAILYHWIDRDYQIALKQGTVEGYQTFLKTYPQSKYTDVITEKLAKEAWRQTKKAEREKDWYTAYKYCKIAYDKYNGRDASDIEKELDKIKNTLMNTVKSKEEAYEVFPPEEFSYSDLLSDPEKLHDKIIEIKGIVLQRAEPGVYLINIGNYIVYVTCFTNHCLRKELQGGGFVAGAPVRILGRVEGAHTYNTALGTTNTVPWLSGIWMESLR